MRNLIVVFVVTVLLLASAPAAVYAASGGVTGSVKGGNTAPTVDAVALLETGSDTPVTAMTPLSEYRVKVTCGDLNTIDDIQTIEVHVYHTSDDGAQSALTEWDADQCGIFLWTKGSGWTMQNGAATTTWALGTGAEPSVFTGTTGDWYLAFEPGELAMYDATADSWLAWARADDESGNATGTSASGATMGAYNEISFDTATITFGDALTGIELGDTGYITSPGTQYITAKTASNATYELGIKSSATWVNGGNSIALSGTAETPPTGDGQFTLIVDDTTSGGGEPKFSTQGVTTTNTAITGHTVDSPTPTLDNADEGTTDLPLYMSLSLSQSGVEEVTYSGTVTFTVTNN